MRDITVNEMQFILSLAKNPFVDYNAHNLSKQLGIRPMGALKIAKKLEKDDIVISKKLGQAIFYTINLQNDYVRQYLKFLLRREAEQAQQYIKVWVREIRKIKSADCALLFGSVLKKYEHAHDIDVLLVTDDKRFKLLQAEIESINQINTKPIHPIYQSKDDLIKNLRKQDPVVLNALKGIAVFGEDVFLEVLHELT